MSQGSTGGGTHTTVPATASNALHQQTSLAQGSSFGQRMFAGDSQQRMLRTGSRDASMTTAKIDVRVGSKYRVLEKLGEGGFGEIYRGVNIITHEAVAIKLEPLEGKHQHLLPEARLYKMLGPDGPKGAACEANTSYGIPRVHWYGLEGDYYVMVIDMCGPSLEDVFNYCSRRFSLKTIIHLGIQMVSRLEQVHAKHVIHRDVKPDNFLLGIGNKGGNVYIIDFGLSKPYRDPRTLQHIGYRTGKHLLGTARYSSVHTHLGVEQSRRDDLEAVAYILIYFLRGSLPWQGAQNFVKVDKDPRVAMKEHKRRENKRKYEMIKHMKLAQSPSQLTKGYPQEFGKFLAYSRELGFQERPNYSFLRSMLAELRDRKGISADNVFEWSQQPQASKDEDPGSPALSAEDTALSSPHAMPRQPPDVVSPPHVSRPQPSGQRLASSSVAEGQQIPAVGSPLGRPQR